MRCRHILIGGGHRGRLNTFVSKSLEAEFVSHCRQRDAKRLRRAQRVGEVESELVFRASSELKHDVVI